MTSYILGDLDISGDDQKDNDENSDFNSFEISSNSSVRSAASQLNESSSKKLEPLHNFNKFQADPAHHEDGGYLRNEAFQGFISKQSPFSFKNPIFYSCPNNKMNVARSLKTNEMQSKRELFPKLDAIQGFSVE